MKALSSNPAASNLVGAVSYNGGGTYSLTGLIVGTAYLWTKGAFDTNVVVDGSITLTATGVFTATGTSVTLTGTVSHAITAMVSPMCGVHLYATTFTPSLGVRQVTVGEFPTANPNWSRQHQISEEAHYVKRGTSGLALLLTEFSNIALTQDLGLTWTPPIILSQPASASVAHTMQGSLVVSAGSEYNLSYDWQQSPDGLNWSNQLSAGTGMFSASVASGGTGYAVGDTLTVSDGTHSVTATLTVTSVNAGVITGVAVLTAGVYTVNPTTPNSVTGGTGSSATIALTFAAFDVATAGTLKVTPASVGANYYRCIVTDDAGAAAYVLINPSAVNGSVTTNGYAILTST